MNIETQADNIAECGHKAGQSIWLAIEDAYNAGLSAKRMRITFDCMLEQLIEELPPEVAKLFSASAYEALPLVAVGAVERAEIDTNAWQAYADFCAEAQADRDAAAADYAYDMKRDERVHNAA